METNAFYFDDIKIKKDFRKGYESLVNIDAKPYKLMFYVLIELNST